MRDPLVNLLLAARRGDEAAARELWATTSPALTGLASSILADHAAAEDALQRVFCAALSLPRKRIVAIDDLKAYLAKAVRNDALNHRRESARRSQREQASQSAAPPNAPAVDTDLNQALAQLTEDDREIIALKHQANLTFEQIALVLELNRNTIASRYRAAIDRLRQNLSADRSAKTEPAPRSEVSHAR